MKNPEKVAGRHPQRRRTRTAAAQASWRRIKRSLRATELRAALCQVEGGHE